MSMLTPLGRGVARTRRPRSQRRALPLVVGLLLLVVTGAAVWWFLLRDHDEAPAVAVAPRPCLVLTPSPTPVATPAAGPSFLPAIPAAPSSVRVTVLNATKRAGLAKSVGDELARRRFVVTRIGNDTGRTVTAAAEVRFGRSGSAAALAVAAQLPGALPMLDARRGAGVDLVIGAGYRALRTPAQASAAATPLRASPTPAPVAPVTPSCEPGSSPSS